MKLHWFFCLLMGLTVSPFAIAEEGPRRADDPHNVIGYWQTPGGAILQINPCGQSVCGRLIWFEELETATDPILDDNNQDESQRVRPLQGIEMIYGFEKLKRGWRRGRIYDPTDGETYKSKLTRLADDTLRVEGCVGPFCKKFIWQPISAEALPEKAKTAIVP